MPAERKGPPWFLTEISPQEKLDAAIVEAKGILESRLPKLAPQKPTVGIATMRAYGSADIVGCIRGTYYFLFDPFLLDSPTPTAVFFTLHELVHQRHAEIMDPIVFQRLNYDVFLSDQDVDRLHPLEFINRLQRRTEDIPLRRTLTNTVTEGLAIFAELQALDSMIQDAYSPDNGDSTKKLHDLRNDIVANNKRTRRSKSKNLRCHFEGMKMFEKLATSMDQEGVIEFVLGVDYEACNNIPIGSPDYKRLVRDPLLLPRVA